MKAKRSKNDILRTAKNISLVVIGSLILAFGTSVFLLPFNLVTGGVSGYSIVIKSLIPYDFITKELIITILTWSLFVLGFFVLGKSFAMKTLISAIVYPIGTTLFSSLIASDFMNGFFVLKEGGHPEIAIILASLFSGVCVGLGCALSFIGGGSTGGLDVIAFTICKIFKKAKRSVVIFAIDAGAVILGMFAIGDFAVSLLGIISAFVAALVIDKVFVGGSKAFVAHIVTEKHDQISQEIIDKIDRTTTVFDAQGGYTGKNKKVVMVSFTMNQYSELMAIIGRVDRDAFMTIHQAHEINGEGWTKYDLKKEK